MLQHLDRHSFGPQWVLPCDSTARLAEVCIGGTKMLLDQKCSVGAIFTIYYHFLVQQQGPYLQSTSCSTRLYL